MTRCLRAVGGRDGGLQLHSHDDCARILLLEIASRTLLSGLPLYFLRRTACVCFACWNVMLEVKAHAKWLPAATSVTPLRVAIKSRLRRNFNFRDFCTVEERWRHRLWVVGVQTPWKVV